MGEPPVKLNFMERLLARVPPSRGESIKITQGYRIALRGPDSALLNGKHNGFYKHGFTIDLYDWVQANVGDTCAQHLWQEGQGDWLFTGSRWASVNRETYKSTLFIDVWIRDRRKAIMFLLAWDGQLIPT